MTQDEIIEMARQAGGIDITNNYVGVTVWLGTDRPDFLDAFAKLAFEKGRIQGMQQEHALWQLSKTSQEIGY